MLDPELSRKLEEILHMLRQILQKLEDLEYQVRR